MFGNIVRKCAQKYRQKSTVPGYARGYPRATHRVIRVRSLIPGGHKSYDSEKQSKHCRRQNPCVSGSLPKRLDRVGVRCSGGIYHRSPNRVEVIRAAGHIRVCRSISDFFVPIHSARPLRILKIGRCHGDESINEAGKQNVGLNSVIFTYIRSYPGPPARRLQHPQSDRILSTALFPCMITVRSSNRALSQRRPDFFLRGDAATRGIDLRLGFRP